MAIMRESYKHANLPKESIMKNPAQDNYNTSGEAKYQIFISSTYEDLKEERQYVTREVIRAEQFPIAMEYFVASNKNQWTTIERFLNVTGCVILIIGKRYGTQDETEEKKRSFTEKEYDYADERGIPILVFISANTEATGKLKDFIQKVENSERLVCYFNDCADLSGAVAHSIANEKRYFINPWYCQERPKQRRGDQNLTNDDDLDLSVLPNNNYWNDDAIRMYEKYKTKLEALPDKWGESLEWEGGKDFRHLFEIRDDANILNDEQRKAGIKKSIRYVSTDASGNMQVTGWYLKESEIN